MTQWKPKEIIVNEAVREDPVTNFFLGQCAEIPVRYVRNGENDTVMAASEILSHKFPSMLDKVLAGKKIVYIAPAPDDAVDIFTPPDARAVCPHFNRLKLAFNGCFYQCDWCYLKGTYRAAYPYITIRAQYDRIKKLIHKKLDETEAPVMFNTGELADSLSMEHLTRAAREFIPWFGHSQNGYLFMLTKSDNVDDILDLPHNGHTIVAWSMNNAMVSRKFEIGAPPFERRLEAAHKAQRAGYPLRIRLDPIVPFDGWQQAYAETVRCIFEKVSPERLTLGTLRFEKNFYHRRNTMLSTGPDLPRLMEEMVPMFSPRRYPGFKRPKSGKYSFTEEKRVEIFGFALNEIRRYSECTVALCKESAPVWKKLGLPLSRCSCVCQLDYQRHG